MPRCAGYRAISWLNALDADHADVDGQSALADAAILNRVIFWSGKQGGDLVRGTHPPGIGDEFG